MAHATIDRARLKALLDREEAMFVANHPRSLELYNKAQDCMLGGVPMHWMKRWEGRFPVYVKSGSGAYSVFGALIWLCGLLLGVRCAVCGVRCAVDEHHDLCSSLAKSSCRLPKSDAIDLFAA
jgi:hypothetical protein